MIATAPGRRKREWAEEFEQEDTKADLFNCLLVLDGGDYRFAALAQIRMRLALSDIRAVTPAAFATLKGRPRKGSGRFGP